MKIIFILIPLRLIRDDISVWTIWCRSCKEKVLEKIKIDKDQQRLQEEESMILDSSPSIEASQESSYSTQSEVVNEINLEKNQKVMEVLGLSPFKEEKISDQKYVSEKIASVASEMFRNLNMEATEELEDEDKDYVAIIDHIKKFIEGKDFDSCSEVLCMIPSNWTISKIMKEFNLTEKRAKAVKKMQREGKFKRQRKTRSDTTPEDVMELASVYYELPHISRQIGDQKNIMKIKLPNGEDDYKARVVLYNNIHESYQMFMQDHGAELADRGVPFSQSMFLKAK